MTGAALDELVALVQTRRACALVGVPRASLAEVVRIEDANRTNPSGIHRDAEGKVTGFNNCSDMYLIVGR